MENPAGKPIQDVKPVSGAQLGNPVEFASMDDDPYAQKNPDHQIPSNPIAGTQAAQSPAHHTQPAAPGENDLDSVLKDVNRSVKNASQPASFSRQSKKDKNSLLKNPQPGGRIAALRHSGLLVPAVVAVAAAVILTVAALLAFKSGSGGLGATTPAASSKSVKAAELLNAMAQNLQTGLGDLNEAQDFSADNLSDKSLGL